MVDRFAQFSKKELDLLWEALSSFSAPERHEVDRAIGVLFQEAAKARRDRAKPIDLGNQTAKSGCDRCDCGCKYWEKDVCVDCGTKHDPEKFKETV